MQAVQEAVMIVQIISPYAGTSQERDCNAGIARMLMQMAVSEGHTPIATHVMLHGVMKDDVPQHRADAMALSKALIEKGIADEIWVYNGPYGITKGMREEMFMWMRAGRGVSRTITAEELQRWIGAELIKEREEYK
jgi:DNA-binding LacI/PurR family transcriptional regulator